MIEFIRKLFRPVPPASVEPAEADTQPAPTPLASQPSPAYEPATVPVATAPLSPDIIEEIEKHVSPPQMLAGCGQSVGLQRDHNEDALFMLSSVLVGDTTQLPFGLFIIADGMGGHQHGEIASNVSMRSMSSHVIHKLLVPTISITPEMPEESLHEIMQEGVLEAQRAILKDASGGGTTLTGMLVMGNQLLVAHVGDSRAYAIYPDGQLKLLTRDHSLVKRLEELGQITSAEAATHPQRNVLYRALGQGEPFEPDVSSYPLPQPGYLMLCSDGLWGVVPEKDILNIIQTSKDPQHACQRMVDAANGSGGPDNISVILIYVPD